MSFVMTAFGISLFMEALMNRHGASERVGAGLPPLRLRTALALAVALASATLPAADERRYERDLAERINAYRSERKLPALTVNATLDRLATEHSAAMAKAHRMSHDGFDARYRASGFRRCIENVGWNFTTPAAQLAAWQASPPHDRNLLDANVTVIGLGERQRYVTLIACQ